MSFSSKMVLIKLEHFVTLPMNKCSLNFLWKSGLQMWIKFKITCKNILFKRSILLLNEIQLESVIINLNINTTTKPFTYNLSCLQDNTRTMVAQNHLWEWLING